MYENACPLTLQTLFLAYGKLPNRANAEDSLLTDKHRQLLKTWEDSVKDKPKSELKDSE